MFFVCRLANRMDDCFYISCYGLRWNTKLIKMPLFSNKFSPKTIPVRKLDTSVLRNEFGSDYAAKELSIDIQPLKLKFGDFEVSFEDGHWIPGMTCTYMLSYFLENSIYILYLKVLYSVASGKAALTHKENIRLRKELEQLEEENNMLRLKFEVLLDMMTDKTVEAEQQAEIQRSQSMGSLKQKNKKYKW